MSYSSIFRTRMKAKGGSAGGREFHIALRSFQQWFASSLRREPIIIRRADGSTTECDAIFEDINQGNSGEKADNKYMITEKHIDTQSGAFVWWRGKDWLIFSAEHKTIPTHNQVILHELNEDVKWIENGEILTQRAYIVNNTLYTLGVSMSGHNAWINNARMSMYLQDNEQVRTLEVNDRLVMNGGIYKIMFRDTVSRNGIASFLLEQDFYAEGRDNLELGIADYYTSNKDDEDGGEVIPQPSEIVIKGLDKLKIGTSIELTSDKPVSEWVISDIYNAVTVIDQTETSIEIRAENNFKKVGSIVNIVAKGMSAGEIGSKTVTIVSPY